MEVLKIIGGLATIAVVIVLFGTGGAREEAAAPAPAPVERNFSSDDSSARFVAAPVPEAAEAD